MAKSKNADPFPWLTDKGKQNTGYYKPQPQPQPQSQPQSQQPAANKNTPQAAAPQKDAATAQAEIAAIEAQRITREKEDAAKKTEQSRYESVSKKEGEKKRKEFEAFSSAEAGKATGGQAFVQKKKGQLVTTRPTVVSAISPSSVQGTILGLPKNTNVFTKFGESINNAANLTFSSPQTRFGGM